jgi:hypothetical protein
VRWAYVTFVLLGLLYFPASVGFRLNPQPCELIPNIPLAVYSLTNYAHIVLFVLFFLMTSAQFRMSQWAGYAWAAVACMTARSCSGGTIWTPWPQSLRLALQAEAADRNRKVIALKKILSDAGVKLPPKAAKDQR